MNKKILWIEDDTDVIGGLMRPFEEAKYYIKIVNTKKEYEELQDEDLKTFNLILLDILLPEGYGREPTERYTGFSILKHIREIRKLNTPVLVFTGIQNEELFKEIRKYTINKILIKPLLPSELYNEVEEVLK